jgi:hypothetical protein
VRREDQCGQPESDGVDQQAEEEAAHAPIVAGVDGQGNGRRSRRDAPA